MHLSLDELGKKNTYLLCFFYVLYFLNMREIIKHGLMVCLIALEALLSPGFWLYSHLWGPCARNCACEWRPSAGKVSGSVCLLLVNTEVPLLMSMAPCLHSFMQSEDIPQQASAETRTENSVSQRWLQTWEQRLEEQELGLPLKDKLAQSKRSSCCQSSWGSFNQLEVKRDVTVGMLKPASGCTKGWDIFWFFF